MDNYKYQTTENANKQLETIHENNFQVNLISNSITENTNMLDIENEDNDYFSHSNKNTDIFLKHTYLYFYYGGYKGYLSQKIKKIINKTFTLFFSSYLLLMINWKSLFDNKDFIYSSPITQNPIYYFVLIYFILYSFQLFFYLLSNIKDLFYIRKVKNLYQDKLKLNDTQLFGIKWNEITNNIVELHNKTNYKLYNYEGQLSSYIINHNISRINNYMIALINHNILKTQTGCLIFTSTYITKDIEWFIKNIFLYNSFTFNNRLNYEYIRSIHKISIYFKIFGIFYLFFIPFKLTYYIITFIFNHAEDIKSKRKDTDISKFGWTNHAKWTFREYNELDHIFNKRLQASYIYADMYKQQYYKPLNNSINSCIIFICKAFLSVIVLITIIDDELLLNMNIMNKNLLWYIALFSFIISFSKIGTSNPESLIYSPEKIMKNIAIYTHYMPDIWKNNCNKLFVREQFNTLYISKIKMFLYDIYYILLSPIIYFFIIPNCAQQVFNFIQDSSEQLNGVGDVCSYSNLEKKLDNNIVNNYRQKITKSYINYKTHNPSWTEDVNNKIIEDIEKKPVEEKELKDFFLHHPTNNKMDYYLWKLNE